MKATENKNFTINVAIEGMKKGPLAVNYKETTDGAPFYECKIAGQKIQLRKDEKWELIWGDLKQETVVQLGAAIDKEL
ncbi:MAG TPA: hypothetical protein VK541_14790 [Pedobacter sp.]|uniref:hypothetical protein n=1 Tax=Pedobacter sp. TaxID=1411316 RepID=UPI002BE9AB87|nr:hypothetical protein [Pedobacter sp.]HMI03748.1 hypothetical protein [Pedobacter sp.]